MLDLNVYPADLTNKTVAELAARRCKEHKVLIELLLNGQREAACDFIRLHLRDAAREKSSS